jgi:hypothetical protein
MPNAVLFKFTNKSVVAIITASDRCIATSNAADLTARFTQSVSRAGAGVGAAITTPF